MNHKSLKLMNMQAKNNKIPIWMVIRGGWLNI